MARAMKKRKYGQTGKEFGQKVLVGSSIVHLSGFSLANNKSKELDLTSLSSKQIRKKIGWL